MRTAEDAVPKVLSPPFSVISVTSVAKAGDTTLQQGWTGWAGWGTARQKDEG